MKKEKSERDLERDFYASLGKRLKRVRLQHGYTQEQVAEILDIAPDHYGKLERGESRISVIKIYQINEFMKLDNNYLIMGEVNEPTFQDLSGMCSERQQKEMKTIIKSLYNLIAGGDDDGKDD